MNNTIKKTGYDNIRILHPDNTLMCYCSLKKANWYIKHQLATLIDDTTIQFTFEPKGYGDPLEILAGGMSNCCVVSGRTDHLTKHHVVPYQYRQFFDSKFKNNNSFDIVLLNRQEHNNYERIADIFKAQLFADFISPELVELNELKVTYKKTIHAYNKEYDKLPAPKQIYLLMKYESLKHKFETEKIDLEKINFNQILVNNIGVVALTILWKHHFIKYAKPKYLPEWWKPNKLKLTDTNLSGKGLQSNKYKKKLVTIDIANKKINALLVKYDLL